MSVPALNVTVELFSSAVGDPTIVRLAAFQLIPVGRPVTVHALFVPISAIVDSPSTFVMSTASPGMNVYPTLYRRSGRRSDSASRTFRITFVAAPAVFDAFFTVIFAVVSEPAAVGFPLTVSVFASNRIPAGSGAIVTVGFEYDSTSTESGSISSFAR